MNHPIWVELAIAYAPSINDITHTLSLALNLWLIGRSTIIKPTSK